MNYKDEIQEILMRRGTKASETIYALSALIEKAIEEAHAQGYYDCMIDYKLPSSKLTKTKEVK